MKITVLCTSLCAASTAIRAFGRFRRSEYLSFINDLETVKANYNPQTKVLIMYKKLTIQKIVYNVNFF